MEFLKGNIKEIILVKDSNGSFFAEGFTTPLSQRPRGRTTSRPSLPVSGVNRYRTAPELVDQGFLLEQVVEVEMLILMIAVQLQKTKNWIKLILNIQATILLKVVKSMSNVN